MLIWVTPLGLYLLTFVLTFRPRFFIGAERLSMLVAWAGALALVLLGLPSGSMLIELAAPLLALFLAALMCNSALYQSRPNAQSLTLFYFAISLGGALGGLFAGLIAPKIFSTVAEYPLLLVAALACRPGMLTALRSWSSRNAFRLGGAIAIIVIAAHIALNLKSSSDLAAAIMFGGLGAVALLVWRNAAAAAFAGLAMALQLTWLPSLSDAAESYRSFFGVNRITVSNDGRFRILVHGRTIHGAIRIRDEDGLPATGRPLPATYYHPETHRRGNRRSARDSRRASTYRCSRTGRGRRCLPCQEWRADHFL